MKIPLAARFLLGPLALLSASSAVSASTLVFVDLHPVGATKSSATGVDAAGQAGRVYNSSTQHAAMWTGTPDSFVDLNPYGAAYSKADCGGGRYQGGSAVFTDPPPGGTHAALWSGSPFSYMDLDPGYNMAGSTVYAVTDSQQGGAYTMVIGSTAYMRALWWSPSVGGFLDLTPTGSSSGILYGLSDSNQVGSAKIGGTQHAALWSGTPDSFVDLQPAGASTSTAYGVAGNLQAGVAVFNGTNHAGCWSGSAASFVDLTPSGASGSIAKGASGTKQVGSVVINGSSHAALWSGNAASFRDLHVALGTAYTNSSASGVWTDGQTTYIAGQAYPISAVAGTTHAILWTLYEPPAPPPLQITITAVGSTSISTLTWANNGVPCALQSSGSITGNWSVVSAIPVTNGDWVNAVSTNTADIQFFRLQAN